MRPAAKLFAVGLIGAAFLAASVLPLSTAYSVCEYAGVEAAVDDPYREARPFYLTFGLVTLVGAVTVLIPGIPLLTILVATQVLNAVLLVPLLFAMIGLGRDRDLMGDFTIGRAGTVAYGLTTVGGRGVRGRAGGHVGHRQPERQDHRPPGAAVAVPRAARR